ncbi:MAG: hypothetical protein ACP5HJ_03440 [Candidatus Micrarchaeia archaeon]
MSRVEEKGNKKDFQIRDKDKELVVECPVCEGKIRIKEDVIVGEIVNCPDCGSNFEVDKINRDEEGKIKISLKQIETQGEDWGE